MPIWDTTFNPPKMRFSPEISSNDRNYESPFDVDNIYCNKYEALNIAIKESFKLI